MFFTPFPEEEISDYIAQGSFIRVLTVFVCTKPRLLEGSHTRLMCSNTAQDRTVRGTTVLTHCKIFWKLDLALFYKAATPKLAPSKSSHAQVSYSRLE